MVLLGVPLAVNLWPSAAPASSNRTAASGDDGLRNSVPAADALAAAAAFRAGERASRNRPVVPVPATPSSTASTPSTPKPEPVPAVVGKLFATTDLNIRSGPSSGDERIGSAPAGARVNITGLTRNGWTQVVTEGRAGWVKSRYLSRSKPTPQQKTTSAPSGVSNAPCSISTSIEPHLTSNARSVYRAVCATFGRTVSSFGGYRAGSSGDHGSGRAVDIMVSGAPGTQIARYVQSHARALGVTYVIYQQRIWLAGDPTSQWKAMEDRGSPTANHFDHVHVSVS